MKQFTHLVLKESLLALALACVLLVPGSDEPSSGKENGLTSILKPGQPGFMAGDYLAARFAERNDSPATAVDYYLSALGKDSKNPILLERAYTLLGFAGDFERAAHLAQRLIAEDLVENTPPLAHLLAALPSLQKGDYSTARRWLSPLEDNKDYKPSTLEDTALVPLLAWCYAGLGHPDQSVPMLNLLSKEHDVAFADYQKILIRFSMDKKARVLALLDTLSIQGQPHRITDMVVYLYRHYGMPEKAEKALAVFQAKEPEYRYQEPSIAAATTELEKARIGMAEALFEMGAQAYRMGDTYTATLFLRAALAMDGMFQDGRLLLAHTLEQMELKDEALAMYQAIPPSSRFYWQAQLASAAVLSHLGKEEEARLLLQGIASERHQDHDALLLLGDILLSGNEFNKAASTYSEALARIGNAGSKDWSVYYARGISYEQAGEWDKAEPDFLKALELSPDQPSVLNYLGYSWLMLDKNVEKAEKMLRVAVAKQPGDAHILDSYGWALYKLGMYSEALIFIERAVMLMPDDPTTNDHLGDLYWRLNRQKEAKFQWKKALAFDPKPKDRAAIQMKLDQGLAPMNPLALAE